MKEENQENQQPEEPHYDAKGNLFIKLAIDDSALVVRADGTIEMVSHDLESSEGGYVGDVEDLSKTFSLVLALAASLEDETLYAMIFNNLNHVLMKQWDKLDDAKKKEITEIRQRKDEEQNEEK